MVPASMVNSPIETSPNILFICSPRPQLYPFWIPIISSAYQSLNTNLPHNSPPYIYTIPKKVASSMAHIHVSIKAHIYFLFLFMKEFTTHIYEYHIHSN